MGLDLARPAAPGGRLGAAVALAAALLVTAACGGPEIDQLDRATAANQHAGEAFGDVPADPGPGSAEVEVLLRDDGAELPDTLPEGSTTFVVTNRGHAERGFEIEGRGLHAELEEPLAPGATAELAVELAAGYYEVFTPVAGHDGGEGDGGHGGGHGEGTPAARLHVTR